MKTSEYMSPETPLLSRPGNAGSLSSTLAEPLVSVVMPSFNQAEFLERALDSVLLQRYSNFELIVMDGGSTDKSLEILERYGARLRHWESAPDRGQCDAINKGFALATGEIMCWLNSDDMFEPGALDEVVRYFNTNAKSMILTGACYCIDENDRFIDPISKRYISDQVASKSVHAPPHRRGADSLQIWFRDWFPQPSTFWRRALWEKVGGLDETYHYSMDYELWRRMARHAEIDVLDRVLSRYRYHSSAKCVKSVWGPLREVFDINRRTMSSEEFGVFADVAGKFLIDRLDNRESRIADLQRELATVRTSTSHRLGSAIVGPLSTVWRKLRGRKS